LIEKLIYLTGTRLDITFVVGVLSRFMHQPRDSLDSCTKNSGLCQKLSKERSVIQEALTCMHFWVLWFWLCWWQWG